MTDDSVDQDFIKARMAQILGQPPRIAPLVREALSDEQTALITALRASIGLSTGSELPEFFLVAVKHPTLFTCQCEAGRTYFTGTISPRERELAVLRIGWLCRAPYEWGEHVDIAKRNGFSGEEIERVKQGSAAAGWSEHQRAILRGVEELLRDQMVCDDTWNTLAQSWSEQQLMEFPMLVGHYVSTAFQQNTLRMRLPANNLGLHQR